MAFRFTLKLSVKLSLRKHLILREAILLGCTLLFGLKELLTFRRCASSALDLIESLSAIRTADRPKNERKACQLYADYLILLCK